MDLQVVMDSLKDQYKDKLLEKKNLTLQLEQVDEVLTKLEGGSEIVAALQSQQEAEEKAKAEEAEEAVLGEPDAA